MFALEPCISQDALDSTSYFEHVLVLPQSAADAFDYLSNHDRDADWFPDFKSARWLTPDPQGVGTVREYCTSTMSALELFTVWERGRRLRFTFLSLSVPVARRFAEDYEFETLSDGRTQVRWRIHYEPSALTLPILPLLRKHFAQDFERAARQLASSTGGSYTRGSELRRTHRPRWLLSRAQKFATAK